MFAMAPNALSSFLRHGVHLVIPVCCFADVVWSMVKKSKTTKNRERPHLEKMQGHLELIKRYPTKKCLSKAEIDVILLRRKIIK